MALVEIIKDAIMYPINNIKALVIYLLLGLLVGLVAVFTGLGGLYTGSFNLGAGLIVGFIGLLFIVCILLVALGFSLDIVKFGIDKRDDAPGIDLLRQMTNGLKYIIVTIVYLIIPIIITAILAYFSQNLAMIVGLILTIIFAFVLYMAICRLAKTESLSHALDISGAIGDLTELGVVNVVITIIVAEIVGLVIVFVLTFVITVIIGVISQNLILALVPIFASVLDAWLLFYSNRVMGLVYSEK